GAQARTMVAGTTAPADAAAARGFRYRSDGPARAGLRPYDRGGAEAWLRRPREFLRRSRRGRGAARNAAVAKICRRAPQADRRTRFDGAAAGRRLRRAGAHAP